MTVSRIEHVCSLDSCERLMLIGDSFRGLHMLNSEREREDVSVTRFCEIRHFGEILQYLTTDF